MNQLFDTLRAACNRQFGFNPRRITAEMRYIGTEGHGKDLMHIFRAAGSHSQIALKGKVCVEAFHDPKVPGVTCHVTQAKTGGISGAVGLAQDPSQFSLACR